MRERAPSQQQARQSLAEAAARAAPIRRADRPLGLSLLILAVIYLVVGTIVGLVGPGGSVAVSWAMAGSCLVGLASVVVVLRRMRAYSRTGAQLYGAAITAFVLWNAVVGAASIGLGWWAPHTPAWHFTASVAIAAIPLAIAAGLFLRRSR